MRLGSKVHGANMGPIWGRQDPGGPHVGPVNFAIWEVDILGSCHQRLDRLRHIVLYQQVSPFFSHYHIRQGGFMGTRAIVKLSGDREGYCKNRPVSHPEHKNTGTASIIIRVYSKWSMLHETIRWFFEFKLHSYLLVCYAAGIQWWRIGPHY